MHTCVIERESMNAFDSFILGCSCRLATEPGRISTREADGELKKWKGERGEVTCSNVSVENPCS
jgi:hypothetical protein